MKRCIAFLCAGIIMISCITPALASNFYIIPDSNTRRLTREELWTWQYDALMYIVNEIFARHGFHFDPGGKYDNYFRAQLWYRENDQYATNQEIYENLVTNTEWYNENLAKQVRDEMKALGTTNPGGKPIPPVAYEPEIYGAFSSFQRVYFAPNQKLPVYTGPGTNYHRSANGKAMASTNGHVYVGGWENGWLMVMYWTNDYNVRVGFTQRSSFKDNLNVPHLQFDYAPATITRRTALTDDPVASFQPMATLQAGTQVTYLSDFFNEKHWAYVEVSVSGSLMRGFIEANAVQRLFPEEGEPSYEAAHSKGGADADRAAGFFDTPLETLLHDLSASYGLWYDIDSSGAWRLYPVLDNEDTFDRSTGVYVWTKGLELFPVIFFHPEIGVPLFGLEIVRDPKIYPEPLDSMYFTIDEVIYGFNFRDVLTSTSGNTDYLLFASRPIEWKFPETLAGAKGSFQEGSFWYSQNLIMMRPQLDWHSMFGYFVDSYHQILDYYNNPQLLTKVLLELDRLYIFKERYTENHVM